MYLCVTHRGKSEQPLGGALRSVARLCVSMPLSLKIADVFFRYGSMWDVCVYSNGIVNTHYFFVIYCIFFFCVLPEDVDGLASTAFFLPLVFVSTV